MALVAEVQGGGQAANAGTNHDDIKPMFGFDPVAVDVCWRGAVCGWMGGLRGRHHVRCWRRQSSTVWKGRSGRHETNGQVQLLSRVTIFRACPEQAKGWLSSLVSLQPDTKGTIHLGVLPAIYLSSA